MASCINRLLVNNLAKGLLEGTLSVFQNPLISVDARGTAQQTNTCLENSKASIDKIDSSLLAITVAMINRNSTD